MPTPSKKTENMSKHLTRDERERREAAERAAMPARGKPRRTPAPVAGDREAKAYWDRIWAQMEKLEILDTLDTAVLAGLCSMLALRDRLATLTPELLESIYELRGQCSPQSATGRTALQQLADALKSATVLSDKRLKLDAQILSYADKLGLTPSGRSRLAVRRAAEEPPDEDADLFG